MTLGVLRGVLNALWRTNVPHQANTVDMRYLATRELPFSEMANVH